MRLRRDVAVHERQVDMPTLFDVIDEQVKRDAGDLLT